MQILQNASWNPVQMFSSPAKVSMAQTTWARRLRRFVHPRKCECKDSLRLGFMTSRIMTLEQRDERFLGVRERSTKMINKALVGLSLAVLLAPNAVAKE